MVSVNKNVDVSKPVKGVPKPVLAYVMYKDEGGFTSATKHVVTDEKLGLGRVVSLSYLADEFENAGAGISDLELLPESVFVNSRETLAWVSKAEKRAMWFNLGGKRRGFNVWWPHLIYIADKKRNSLRVFAVRNAKRPTLDTKLYHAPLMNISDDGVLCAGSARLPRKLCVETLDRIEACVTDSCFTHVNHRETIRGISTNSEHVGFWRGKEKAKGRVKVGDLNQRGTLAEVLGR